MINLNLPALPVLHDSITDDAARHHPVLFAQMALRNIYEKNLDCVFEECNVEIETINPEHVVHEIFKISGLKLIQKEFCKEKFEPEKTLEYLFRRDDDAVLRISVDGERIRIYVACVASNDRPNLLEEVRFIVQRHEEQSNTKQAKNSIYSLIKQYDDFAFKKTFDIEKIPLEKGNYAEHVIAGYNTAIEAIKNKDAKLGRLVIIDGPPGTGKTHLIKGLVNEIGAEAGFALVKSSIIGDLMDPSFLDVCRKFRSRLRGCPIVFLVEDADNIIAPRMADNVGILSDLLNLTDGLAGTSLDIRVVATTNAEVEELDDALLRPGRLAARIEVNALSVDESNEVIQRLGIVGKKATRPMTLAEIYDLRNENKREFTASSKKKKAGFVL